MEGAMVGLLLPNCPYSSYKGPEQSYLVAIGKCDHRADVLAITDDWTESKDGEIW